MKTKKKEVSNMDNRQQFSTRAQVVTRRTYNRPKDDGTFETWEETVGRVIGHQQWLWERAKGAPLVLEETLELNELRELMLDRKATVSGRTLWLGGTDVSKNREASQFNCSFGRVETVHDVVDAFWLLLQGCGVGFEPVVGTLNGFVKPVDVEIIRSKKQTGDGKGHERNMTKQYNRDGNTVWHLTVGDSAEAWAKAIGKIMALKEAVDVVVIDFSEVRAAGIRLKGYGWISSGDETISVAFKRITDLMNKRAGKLLTRIDILDLLNHLGTTLSSRRSAEIALMPVTDAEIDDFISAKKDFWLYDNAHRQQSNNSIVFWNKPTNWELRYIFDKMVEAGGSEPGFINGEAAKKRAPWFKGVNPCAEILLGNKSFCNLVEIDWGKFITDFGGLQRAVYISARANYRQTCVDLDDGVLQRSWHELNEFLRLCGVGATGIVKFIDAHKGYNNLEDMVKTLRKEAQKGAHSMADELGLPRAKAVTTVKPSGTLSKIMDTTEGVHKPLGKYIFNNVTFSKHDEIIPTLRQAGYKIVDKPFEPDSVLVTFPAVYDDVKFDVVDGVEVNVETALLQLERYKFMMDNYVDHNCSVTISYDPSEVEAIVNWILENWDSYVGVSFIYRNDPTKTAEDLGYAYLPQEVVTKEKYYDYANNLWPVDLTNLATTDDLSDEACATGACPIR
jgi:adenosylcobalamin-dependent ribonucleoside-triphosphate reductase